MERAATLVPLLDAEQHSYNVIYPRNHEKVSVLLKSQVFAGHTTQWARSIMSLFYMAHFKPGAASYAISEALIYCGGRTSVCR